MFSKMLFEGGLPTWALFAELAVAGAIVIVCGARLARLADALATRLGISAGWIGLILLATITSLPEVVAGSTAVAIGNTDLAFAAVFGSCSFNITLIVLVNGLAGGGSVLRRAGGAHTLTSSFGLLLMTLSLLAIMLVDKFHARPYAAQLCECIFMFLIVVAYLAAMRLTYLYEKAQRIANGGPALDASSGATTRSPSRPRIHGTYIRIGLLALALVSTSWWLTQTGDILSTHEIELIGRPLGATFVGAVFLACATSLPEIATSVAAVRLGNLDLALGNIFGSNMFNIFVFPMLKLVSTIGGQPLLMSPDRLDTTQNLIAGLLPILLTAIAVGGLTYRSKRKLLRRFGFDSVLIGVTYICGMWLLLMSTPK